MELARFLANLHPLLVHFPIAFWLAAIALDGWGWLGRNEKLHTLGKILLALGTLTALYAVVCGIFAETFAARAGIPTEPMETHELLALISTWGFALLTVARLYIPTVPTPTERSRFFMGYLALGIVLCLALAYSAYLGGELVYHYGAGVEAARLPFSSSDEDLVLLAQQQTPETLAYSEFMHHSFGWLVLGLSLLLLAQTVQWKFVIRHHWFDSALLIAGGIFLLIFSDQDSWPLSSARSIFDKEVLFHKTIASLLLAAGIGGLLRQRSNRPTQPARLVAILALIGGSLLFTHLHSVAPYANVALGVYLHHTVLGTIALAIGAAKLLEEKLPRLKGLFPLLIALESIFLIKYNEGLPWFLGYDDFRHVALHGGVLSDLGHGRAELTFDPTTQQIEVYLLHPTKDEPLPLPIHEARLRVRFGTETTEIPLQSPGTPAADSHFTGTARFLREAKVFSATLYLPPSPLNSISYFEPWVTPRKNPLLVIGTAKFACPMHEFVQSNKTEPCPLCKMQLVPLHSLASTVPDPRYTVDLKTDPNPVVTGQTTTLILTPKTVSDSKPLDLQLIHEKLLHLLIVRRDFGFFDHVHPQRQPDGVFTLPYQFPSGGEFLLFADLTPVGERMQVFRLPLQVSGANPKVTGAPSLHADAVLAREFHGVRVALQLDPSVPRAGKETSLSFTLSQDGQPLHTLSPWLGAMGHCLALSEDTQTFLHFHPLNDTAPNGQVTFHAHFPHPGLYKLWAQFRPDNSDRVLTVDFVISVR